MFDENMKLAAQTEAGFGVPGSPRKMTTRDRLVQQKRHMEAELKNVNAALEALDQYPEIDKVLELIGRAL